MDFVRSESRSQRRVCGPLSLGHERPSPKEQATALGSPSCSQSPRGEAPQCTAQVALQGWVCGMLAACPGHPLLPPKELPTLRQPRARWWKGHVDPVLSPSLALFPVSPSVVCAPLVPTGWTRGPRLCALVTLASVESDGVLEQEGGPGGQQAGRRLTAGGPAPGGTVICQSRVCHPWLAAA